MTINIDVEKNNVQTYWLIRNDDGTYDISVDTENNGMEFRNVSVEFTVHNNIIVPIIIIHNNSI